MFVIAFPQRLDREELMNALKTVAGVSLVLVFALVAVAGDPPAPQPTAEHHELEMWVGTWSGQAEMKPGPFGPGGPMTWTQTCTWFEGGTFHVVCRSEETSPMGPMKGLGIIGYKAEKKVYTHYGVDSSGWSGYAEGTRTGDTWEFQSQETIGDTTFHSRYRMTLVSPNTMEFTWSMSEDGTNWVVMMEGTSEKQ